MSAIAVATVRTGMRGSSPRMTGRSNAGPMAPACPCARMNTFADVIRGSDVRIAVTKVRTGMRGSGPRMTGRSKAGAMTLTCPYARMSTFADVIRDGDVSNCRREGSHVDARVKPAHDEMERCRTHGTTPPPAHG